MSRTTIGLGIILFVLGLLGFFMTGMQSPTALIPAFLGIVFLILGIIARKESARKMSMHIAMIIALLGLIGTYSGLINFFVLITGGEIARPAAVISQTIMALLLIYYLVLGIKSFIDARRKET